MRKTLHIAHTNLCITWDDERLDGIIDLMFKPWSARESSCPADITIAGTDGSYELVLDGVSILCSDDRDLAAQLEYALTCCAQDILVDFLQIHGACFGFGGKGLLAAGGHGSGKTTLVLAAVSSGWTALTDDICVIRNDFKTAMGFPRPFRIDDVIESMVPGVIPDDSPRFRVANDCTYVFFHEPPGLHYTDSLGLKRIVFPVRGGNRSMRDLGETEALERMLPQGFNFNLRPQTIVKDLLRLIANAPPCEIIYNDPWEAVALLHGLLS